MIRALREGALDAGLAATPLELPGVSEHTVCRETLYAYLPRGHRLCAQTSVRQADLLDEQVWLLAEGHCFRTQVLALCSVDRASRPDQLARVEIDAGSFETLVGFVDAGMGVTVLPELFVRRLSKTQRAEQVRCFQGPEPVRQIGCLYTREHLRWGILRALLRVLTDVIPAELRSHEAQSADVLALHPQRSLES